MASFRVSKTVFFYDKEIPEGAYTINSKKISYYDEKKAKSPRRTYCIKELEMDDGSRKLYAKSIVLCRKEDAFIKKRGREIAEGRANKIKNWLNNNVNKIDYTTADNLLESYSGLSKAELKCMKLLASSSLSPLEKRLFGLEKPEDEFIPPIADAIPLCGTKLNEGKPAQGIERDDRWSEDLR